MATIYVTGALQGWPFFGDLMGINGDLIVMNGDLIVIKHSMQICGHDLIVYSTEPTKVWWEIYNR